MASIGIGAFWVRLRKACDEQIAQQAEFLADGSAQDLAEYKLRAGIIRGLRQALDAGRDILGQDDKPRPAPGDDDED